MSNYKLFEEGDFVFSNINFVNSKIIRNLWSKSY